MAHVMEESEDQVRNWVFGNQDSSVRFEVVTLRNPRLYTPLPATSAGVCIPLSFGPFGHAGRQLISRV